MNILEINDLNKLNDRLEKEIAWRKRELSSIKENIYLTDGFKKETMLRAGVTLLYAHWEGFIKNAATFYLCYVSSLKLKYSELTTNFLALAIKSDIDEKLIKPKKNTLHSEIINTLLQSINEESRIPYKNKIDTRQNLNSENFKDIMAVINFNIDDYKLNYNLLDAKLLNMRNQIAHGEVLKAIALDESTYFEMYEKILDMMEKFKEQVFTYSFAECYKKGNNR